ncbi:MAG: DNA polymerase III subunit gamma/tau, partial [Erysipelotrichaceae bacterium]|nr:DNA polymerase III subunit gamma/tau [Erysipelotrichaceae bacterium]
ALNCEAGLGQICDNCFSCLAITAGNHPDVFEIDAASNNGVDQVRELIETVRYLPLRGRYKVFIIDEIHMMSSQAFNALLKTIEEPPEHVIFIFATTEPHKVLPTILSRVQHFTFARVSDFEIENRLKKILKAEDVPYEDEAIKQLVSLSEGGLRDALSLADEVIAYGNNAIMLKSVLKLFSLLSNENKVNILLDLFENKKLDLSRSLDLIINDGVDVKKLTNDLLLILKEVLIMKLSNEMTGVTLKAELLHRFDQVSLNEISSLINYLIKLQAEYKNLVSLETYFSVSLLNYTPKEVQLIARPMPTPTTKEKVMPQEPLPKEISLPPKAAKEVVTSGQTLNITSDFIIKLMSVGNKLLKKTTLENWPRLSSFYEDTRLAKFAALLNIGRPYIAYKDFLVLECDFESEAKKINLLENQNYFQEILETLFGTKFHVLALTNKESNQIVSRFRELQQVGKLQKAQDIEIKYEDLL